MLKSEMRYVLMFAATAIIICSSGCRTKPRPKAGEGAEDISFDKPMGNRFETGERININFENVLFDYDSFKIKQSEVSKIDAVASYMSQNKEVVCILEGHCDERGSNEYNMSLGEQRAQSVRQQLIGLGISSDRLQTRSYGEEKPIDPGHNEAAWQKNRRVEFALFK
mgnify:CR=1 FL=1